MIGMCFFHIAVGGWRIGIHFRAENFALAYSQPEAACPRYGPLPTHTHTHTQHIYTVAHEPKEQNNCDRIIWNLIESMYGF